MMKNIFTNKKMIIVSILAISLLAVLSFFVVKGITGTMNKVMVPPPTFIRAGTIKTLIENNDKYFLKIENFTEDGEYASPATEKQLTYKEYALIRANKDYDIFEVRKEGTIKSRYLSYLNRTTKDNQELLGNYLAEIIDGTFAPIKFVDSKEQRTILIDDDGTYYVATKFLDENGDYTQPAIYMMVDAETYNEHILSKKFDYQMVTEYRSEGNATLIITSFYDPNGEMIKRPIILHLTGFTNIEDYIRTVAPELLPSDEDKDTGDKGEDKTPGEGGGKGGSGDSGSGSDSGSGVQEPQAPWTGSDFTWYDIWDLMGDAATTWNDEYWNGETSESAWSDDFFNDYGQGSESELEYGYIDDNGRFIRTDEAGNVIPSEPGKFDEAGNFKPEGSDGYYDTEGIKHPDLEKDTGGKYDEKGNFYPEGQDGYFDSEGTWHPGTGESGGKAGHYDSEGNFILDDGSGYYDKEGVFHPSTGKDTKVIDEQGRTVSHVKGALTIDREGNIVVVGEEGYYDEKGLIHLPDGRVGYYDGNGTFIESRTNPYAAEGGFYDKSGKFHSFNEVYEDSNKSLQLVNAPEIGLTASGDKLFIAGEEGYFDEKGLVHLPDGRVGYYDEHGNFIESTVNPYKGGFYDSQGNWIDDSLYSKTADGKLQVNQGMFDNKGNYITPAGDIGHFDETGKFIPYEMNPYEGGYYDQHGQFHEFGDAYIDQFGYVRVTGEDEYIDKHGNVIKVGSEMGIKDEKGNIILPDGTVITPEGKVGYYNEKGEFVQGTNPYSEGHYDSRGNFVMSDGTVITPDGKVGYYNAKGEFVEGEIPYKGGYYDAQGNFITDSGIIVTNEGDVVQIGSDKGVVDSKGNIILPDGTVITPEGKVGYYNEKGEFVEGTKPYKDGYYDAYGNFIRADGSVAIKDNNVVSVSSDKGVIDAKGNTILPDGTVITPDGRIGYYNEQGEFVEGTKPYKDGYYDAYGNFIKSDGTVVTPDGRTGYYNEKGEFVEGRKPYQGGYYDAQGNFITDSGDIIAKSGKVVQLGSDVGVVDAKGNIIKPDGTVVTPDGKVGYYNEKGQFVEGRKPYTDGYYDAQGNFIKSNGTVVTSDGEIGYYNEQGKFVEGTKPYSGGYYDAQGNFITSSGTIISKDTKVVQIGSDVGIVDGKGNIIMPDGTVVTPEGKVGYYNEAGKFVEGTKPYEGGYYDAQGNFIRTDGTVVTADGRVGYYNEQGKFVEGTKPYEGGYYDAQGNFITSSGAIITKEGEFVQTTAGVGVIDEEGNVILPSGVVISSEGKIGYYNEKGEFVEGKNPYSGGYYDAQGNFIKSNGTVVTSDGEIGYYNAEGKFVEGTKPYEGGYYDAQGNFITESGAIIAKGGKVIMPDGTSVEGRIDAKGNIILTDGTVITPEGKVGYYDKEGKFVEGSNPSKTSYYDEHGQLHTKESKYYDEEGNIIEGVNPDTGGFYDSKGNYYMTGDSGYFDKQGTYHTADGKIGYYDEKGQFHEGTNPYQGGFYDKEGKWHGEGEAGKLGYYDSEGQWHEGTSPYEGGYYDKYGNWHPSGKNEYVDKYGNIHKQGDNAIGYIDAEGNFRMKGQDGYYDKEGNYHSPDGKIGYYDKEGKFHEGINPYEGGFYDAQGNWHPEGDKGYYDKSGKYHPSVSDEEIGYYDKDGKWNEGTSPYKGGYYDEKGNWHPFDDEGYYDKEGNYHSPDGKVGYFDKEGKFHEGKNPNKEGYYDKEGNFITFKEGQKKGYYDKSGNWHEGVSPYKDGFYDQHGNWHPKGADGYYDKTGTFRTKDGKVGYYDKYGNFHEGTNPYKTGYYDAEGNFHPFDEDGYFDSEGTWHSADGEYGYYDEKGQFHKGKTNPYKGGYYDKYGNWHPFDEEGYYDSAGNFHLLYDQDDRYRVGSDNYILNEGYFRNPTDKRAYRKAGNTVQFTINGSDFTPRYIDTGIYVGQNAILQYDEIQDILHNIALQTGNVFVKDNYSCMLIYKGRVIKFNKADLISIREIREKFLDTDIIVKVAKSRIGGKYNFAEAVETKQDINFVYDGKPFTISNPLTVRDNEVLVPLNDFMQFFVYRTQVKEKSGEIIFTLDKGKVKQMQDIATSLRITVDDVNVAQEINGETKQIELKTPPIRIEVVKGEEKQIYIPVKLLPILTGKDVIWDANTFTLTFREKSNIILNTDMPEASIVSNATYKERTRYSD